MCDLQEEGSRRHFINKCTSFLISLETPEEILEEGLLALRKACTNEQDYLQNIIEIIECLDSQESKELVQLRIVSILTPVLESASEICNEQILMHHAITAMNSNNSMLREADVACLGRPALFSKECNETLLQIMNKEDETIDIRAQALLAVSDWTMSHNDDDIKQNLQSHVSRLFDDEHNSVVALAAEVAESHFKGNRKMRRWSMLSAM